MVNGWGEADAALAELGGVERQLAAVEDRRRQATAWVEAEAAQAARSLRRRRARLCSSLERFCRERYPALSRLDGHSLRSRRLLFGRVGFRASQALVVVEEAAALRALSNWRAGQQFLRVRTELDREALRAFLLASDEAGNGTRTGLDAQVRRRLRRAGIELMQREKWFYEVDERALERWGARQKRSGERR
jgi:phage host-nuclease inhibitor protein Gam